jgi:hypothetical protein
MMKIYFEAFSRTKSSHTKMTSQKKRKQGDEFVNQMEDNNDERYKK